MWGLSRGLVPTTSAQMSAFLHPDSPWDVDLSVYLFPKAHCPLELEIGYPSGSNCIVHLESQESLMSSHSSLNSLFYNTNLFIFWPCVHL